MGWKVEVWVPGITPDFGTWCPASPKYFGTRTEAEDFRKRFVKYSLGGDAQKTRIVQTGKPKPKGLFFQTIDALAGEFDD
ncbi:MAG: hypothetical protein R6U11_07715 [Bacteroidales bacterium]